MATQDLTVIGNIFDVLKFKAPNGSAVDGVVNSLVEIDHFSEDMPALPANGGLTHHVLRTVALPTGYFVDIGGSWKSSKSQREPYSEGLCTIRSTYQAPVDTYKQEAKEIGQAQLSAEKTDHIIMMNQSVGNLMMNGTTVPNQSALVGLMKRSPYTTYDSKFCFSVGGTGSNLRSAWLMKPGIDTVHSLYNPNHPTLGIEQRDMGEQKITNDDDSTVPAGEHRWDIMIEFMITKGICVRDMTAVKRICNIPVGSTDNPGEDVVNVAIEASIINATKKPGISGNGKEVLNTWMLYCDEWVYAKLVQASNNKTFVYMSDSNIYRTKLPMIGDNIILRRMDALNHDSGSGETAVAAAS
jgi:hypothetical protein